MIFVSGRARPITPNQQKLYSPNRASVINQTKPNQTKPNQTKPNQILRFVPTKPTKPNQTKPNQTIRTKIPAHSVQ